MMPTLFAFNTSKHRKREREDTERRREKGRARDKGREKQVICAGSKVYSVFVVLSL